MTCTYTPIAWKRGTLKTLTHRAYNICSTTEYRQQEIEHLTAVFKNINGYPTWLITQVFNQLEEECNISRNNLLLMLSIQGPKGQKSIEQATKLSTNFSTKDAPT